MMDHNKLVKCSHVKCSKDCSCFPGWLEAQTEVSDSCRPVSPYTAPNKEIQRNRLI